MDSAVRAVERSDDGARRELRAVLELPGLGPAQEDPAGTWSRLVLRYRCPADGVVREVAPGD